MTSYRTRFAPSPSGRMHWGHARTALLTWLRARARGGTIVMRIEDLDPPRVVPGSADAIMATHEWLGLDWDEGPLYQSDRGAAYERALATLTDAGAVYPCTCTRREIAAIASAPHDGLGPVYPGTCRDGVTHPDRSPSFRFRMPVPSPPFVDVFGSGASAGAAPGDFIVRRADGLWAYQLAVVVDDIAMEITEVVRGDDLILSTPRQIALFDALGATAPRFAHVGLVYSERGARLAKRDGVGKLHVFRDAGWSAERVIGWLAHSLGLLDSPHPISARTLLGTCDLAAVNASSAVAPTWGQTRDEAN